jgi:hypothetical protein
MDPRVGVKGGAPCVPLPAGQMQPPCMPGTTACVGGMVVCQGEVGPQPNQCNGISTDCTGMPNVNGSCPNGSLCFQGNCELPCVPGEFPCPGGFICDTTKNPPTGLCIPDSCVKANCPMGQLCKVDSQGNATCVDPCKTVSCPTGYQCEMGACVESSCRNFGCMPGQKCVGSPGTCVPDPCYMVTCPEGQFCDAMGQCVAPCTTCMKGEICSGGQCVPDPCVSHPCPVGQACAIMQGVAMCVEDQCTGVGCNVGLTCCQGMCVADPCLDLQCPSGTVCSVDETCSASCAAPTRAPKDEIVAAGGGGGSCSMSSSRGRAAGTQGWLGLLSLLLALGLGRRRYTRKGECE